MEASMKRPVGVAARIDLVALIGWVGMAFGLLGAWLMALKAEWAGMAVVAYLVSNMCWLHHATKTKTWSMFLMQIGFTGSSLLGLYRVFA